MQKKWTDKAEIDRILQPLRPGERDRLLREKPSPEEMATRILSMKKAMRRDLWVGIPWFGLYIISLLIFQLETPTYLVMAAGFLYFAWSMVKDGGYGNLRRRVRVMEALVEYFSASSGKL